MRRARLVLLLICCGACSRQAPRFSLENARAHVQMLAGTIGSRPIGTPENQRAREYVVDQLRLYGYDVRVQEVDARRPEFGRTARVANVIAVKRGAERGGLAIVSHYDSVPEAPGAADDGSGVAVSLEAARVLAARPNPRHSVFILVTDGEEAALMGAAGLMTDRDVMDRLQAYINLDAIGAAGPALLFETGPGNAWIVKPWARTAPHPRGDSYALEIYRRLPNDTDFSIFRRHNVPGLNFALFRDGYPYHTARDTPERLSDDALRMTGENVVQVAMALDAMDLSSRSTASPTFFDIGQTAAVAWGPVTAWFVAAAALVFGLLAWFKVLGASVRLLGTGLWIFEAIWTLIGAAAVGAAMVGGTWALRATRAVYHPWYAHPQWMFLLLVALGVLAAWLVSRTGAILPARLRAPRHPVVVWSLALPIWIPYAGVLAVFAPSGGHMATLPLLVAGICLLVVPSMSTVGVRAVSVLVLAVAGTLWLRGTLDMMRFAVTLLAEVPIVTPVWVYAAMLMACATMLGPPLIAAITAVRPLRRPSIVTAVLLIAVVVAAGVAYEMPAYTYGQPQRRAARVLIDAGAAAATYEVTSQEPGLDLEMGAPPDWRRVTGPPPFSVPVSFGSAPFVFRTTGPSPGPPPASIADFTLKPVADGTTLTMRIVPQAPGLTAVFVLPAGVVPARSSYPGVMVDGRWRVTYVAIPLDGVTWEASFKRGLESTLPSTVALIVSRRFPGGSGWQSLPSWLPQEHVVWQMGVVWALTPPATIAPVPPLKGP